MTEANVSGIPGIMIADAAFHDAALKERELMRTANHLSDFGTLTSLASTAVYILEREVLKNELPKIANKLLLGAMTVGIGSVVSSFYVRHQASKVALDNDQRVIEAQKSWAARQDAQDNKQSSASIG